MNFSIGYKNDSPVNPHDENAGGGGGGGTVGWVNYPTHTHLSAVHNVLVTFGNGRDTVNM